MTKKVTFNLDLVCTPKMSAPDAHPTYPAKPILKKKISTTEKNAILSHLSTKRERIEQVTTKAGVCLWNRVKISTVQAQYGCKKSESGFLWISADHEKLLWKSSLFS